MARWSVPILSLFGFLAVTIRVAAAEPPARAENVIIVTLDGFRHQDLFNGAELTLIDPKAGGVRDVDDLKRRYWRESPEARRQALLPFLWGTVARSGQVFGDRSRGAPARLTNGLKFSYPGYNELFCGFGDPRIDSNDNKPNPNLSVLEFLDELDPFRGRVAVFGTWDVFNGIFRGGQNRLTVHAGWRRIADRPLTEGQKSANFMLNQLPRYWPDNVYDAFTMAAAREHLVRHRPRILYLALGETDEWAHGRRYDLYLDAAHNADRFLSELWKEIQELPEYRGKTALLVTTDHGRGSTPADWTSHGKDVVGAEDIWIAIMGPGTPALGVRQNIESTQSQVAATIAHLVGEDFVSSSPKSARALPGVIDAKVDPASP